MVVVDSGIAVAAGISPGGSYSFTKKKLGSPAYKWQEDSPSLRPVIPSRGNCAPRRSVQSRLILRAQIGTYKRGDARMADSEEETREMGERMPSMISISPPAGHGPAWLRVQKAGQVAQPVGMCARSRTNIPSLYAFCEVMRKLSRPRADASTVDQSSTRIVNVPPSAESRSNDLNEERRRRNPKAKTYHMPDFCSLLHPGSRS